MARLLALFAAASAAALLPGTVIAQAGGSAQRITAQDIARHIDVIAHDSMRDRDTPSRGLELTAQYVADQFQRLDLKPGAEKTRYSRERVWLQRYQIPLQYKLSESRVVFTAGAKTAVAGLTTAAYMPRQAVPNPAEMVNVVLIAGKPTGKLRQSVNVANKIILYVAPAGMELRFPGVVAGMGQGTIILSGEDSATFHRRLQSQRPYFLYNHEPSYWAVHVRPEAVEGLRDILAANGIDLARLRTDSTPVMRELPDLQVTFEAQFHGIQGDTATAPNVAALIEGSDPKLKDQHIIFTAHMDHVGADRGQAIRNGASDNASGVAALIELAEAFSQPGARPRRSLVFVATSGSTKGFWGSTFYLQSLQAPIFKSKPTLNFVANINLDMIGGSAADSVMVYGLNMLELEVALEWVIAAHPNLRLAVVDGGTVFSPESDHFAFATGRRGIPSLSFQTKTHKSHREMNSAMLDAGRAARIARLVYYVGQAMANTDQPPRWNAVGRQGLLRSRP